VRAQESGHELRFFDENTALDTEDAENQVVEVTEPGMTLKATLVWTDPPGEGLQNDLDLLIVASDGTERRGNVTPPSTAFDRVNNVEQVVWENIPAGAVTITVRAHRIALHPQSYALVLRVVPGP
jgi:hypothetical protein